MDLFQEYVCYGYYDQDTLARDRALHRDNGPHGDQFRHVVDTMAVFSSEVFPSLSKRHYSPRQRALVTSNDEVCERHLSHLKQVIGDQVLESTAATMVDELVRIHQILTAKYGDFPAPKSFAEVLADKEHPISVYKGETTRTLQDEGLRWATESGSYNGTMYEPNITWNTDGLSRKVTKREATDPNQLACNSFFVATFSSRIQARLFERSWHLMIMAHLAIVYNDYKRVERRLTLWKTPSKGPYNHRTDQFKSHFHTFLTYSAEIPAMIDNRMLRFNDNTPLEIVRILNDPSFGTIQ